MRKHRHSHNALPRAVGELELLIMQTVWRWPGCDARTIAVEIASERQSSLSTIQTTLERLVRKQLLVRKKISHAYLYYAAQSRGELLGSMMKDVIRLLHDGQAGTILSSFVNVAANLDDQALDELELLIRKKKARERPTGREDDHD